MSTATSSPQPCATGIAGLDEILSGGLPRHRFYLVQGDPGVGKTTLALQFLLEGLRQGEKGLYITLSETKDELVAVAASHGWDLGGLEILELSAVESRLAEAQNTLFHPSELELTQTVQLLIEQVERVRPERVVFDSLSEIRLLSQDPLRYRRQMLSFKQFFSGKGTTVLLLDDRTATDTDLQVQSIAHGVLWLRRMQAEFGAERRQLCVVKLRGAIFLGGNHDYCIRTGGLEVYPRLVVTEGPADVHGAPLTCGLPGLDALLGGGLDRGTSTLFLGPAGAGKSTLACQYAVAAASRGEKAAIYIFDENTHTYIERAEALGMPLGSLVREGRIHLRHVDAAEISPGELTHALRLATRQEGVKVVLIDSLNGYLSSMPEEKFLSLQLHELLTFLSQRGVASILVMAQHGILGDMRSAADLTYLADTVVLLRYFEVEGAIRKAISVIKKRTGYHEPSIRELRVTQGRLHVGETLREFQGVLKGVPVFQGRDRPRRDGGADGGTLGAG